MDRRGHMTIPSAVAHGIRSGGVLPLVVCFLACAAEPRRPPPPGDSMESTALSSDGVAIAYEVQGGGSPTVVLVHGWSCDRSYWDGQLGPLSLDHRVVALDLGGHGGSGTDRESWTIESFGRDVASVADALGLEEMVLVGHSMGGDVVLEAARHLSGRVVGLVWVDTYRQLGSPRTEQEVTELVAPFRADFAAVTADMVPGMFGPAADPALVTRIAADMSAAPPDIAVESLESSFTYGRQVTTPVRELNLPIVAINPSEPPTDVQSLEEYGVEVVLVPDVGHFMMLEDPDRFNAVLEDVIRGLQGR
jgi:pimeloyl-ACP methyl ester carboxylesterase